MLYFNHVSISVNLTNLIIAIFAITTCAYGDQKQALTEDSFPPKVACCAYDDGEVKQAQGCVDWIKNPEDCCKSHFLREGLEAAVFEPCDAGKEKGVSGYQWMGAGALCLPIEGAGLPVINPITAGCVVAGTGLGLCVLYCNGVKVPSGLGELSLGLPTIKDLPLALPKPRN